MNSFHSEKEGPYRRRPRYIKMLNPKIEFIPSIHELQIKVNPKEPRSIVYFTTKFEDQGSGRQHWAFNHKKSPLFRKECLEYGKVEQEEFFEYREKCMPVIIRSLFENEFSTDLIRFLLKNFIFEMWEDMRDINAACFYHLALHKPRFKMPRFLIILNKTNLFWKLLEIRRKIYSNIEVYVNNHGERYFVERKDYERNMSRVYLLFLKAPVISDQFAGQDMSNFRAKYLKQPECEEFIRRLWEVGDSTPRLQDLKVWQKYEHD